MKLRNTSNILSGSNFRKDLQKHLKLFFCNELKGKRSDAFFFVRNFGNRRHSNKNIFSVLSVSIWTLELENIFWMKRLFKPKTK